MKNVVVVICVVVLAVVAAAAGFLYGTSRFTGQFNITDLAQIGSAAQPMMFQFGRGQFDPSQMSQEQLQQLRQARGTPGAQSGFNRQGGQIGGPGGVFGTIESIQDGMLTVKTQNGSVQVKATDTTLIDKQMSVTLQDLKVGEQVSVSGSQGADGVTTARSIRVMNAPAQQP